MAITAAGTDVSSTAEGDGSVDAIEIVDGYSHTLVAGSDRLVLVYLGAEHDSDIDGNVTATYGGNAMTEVNYLKDEVGGFDNYVWRDYKRGRQGDKRFVCGCKG